MRNQRSIGVNAGLNMIRTACQVIFPLITFPYVSRVLHVENIGIYNFCQSVISYFSLLAALGISTYAIREGARYRDNEEKMSLFASEVFSINFISTVFSYLILGVCILLVPRFNQYSSIMVALSISIMFTLIGSEWIFQIYEDYKYITIRGILFQFISLILMFVLVRNSSDLFAYVWITVISCSGANILNAVSRRKYCKIRLTINAKILTHLAPILVLFATSVATTIYTNADTTMLGFFYDFNAPGIRDLIEDGAHLRIDHIAGCQSLVQFQIADDVSQRRRRQRLHGDHRVLHAVGIELRVRNLEIDDGVDLHRNIILRDDRLRRIIQYLLFQADPLGDPVDKRHFDMNADAPDSLECAQAFNDIRLRLLHDLHIRQYQNQHQYDDDSGNDQSSHSFLLSFPA